MEQIVKGRAIELPVIERKSVNSKQCYIVETPDGRRQAISMLRFQFEEEVPQTLRCIVKDINPISGELTLDQDFGPFLRRFYETGKEYPFTVVKETHSVKKRKVFTLLDSYGFLLSLHESAGTKLYAHQHVRCVVETFNGSKLTLKLSDASRKQSNNSKNLQQRIAEKIAEGDGSRPWNRNTFISLIFNGQDRRNFEEQCTTWLQSELQESPQSMSAILDEIHDVCLMLLEGCDLLKNEKQTARYDIQERLSQLLDLTERFMEAVDIVEKDECNNYIDSLLGKLSCSGYLYHPTHRLGMLITIFALRTDLMEQRMDDLLEVIQQSTLDYWKQEPFRSAFIRLLEMYIKAGRVNADLLSVNAGSNVRSLLKALSVQLLLINSIDKEEQEMLPCDVRLNLSMLYRYASYFMTRSPKTLLERSFCALMEEGDAVIYFNWDDTKNVEVLSNKLSAYVEGESVDELNALLQHEYKGQKARLTVNNSGLVITPNTDDEVWPVLPEELNLWHQLQVMLPVSLTKKTRTAMETLRPYKQMWAEIEQAIFQEKLIVKKAFRKVLPEQGEEVYVRVTDVEGDTLHCVIEEDQYKGEGTMAISDIVDWNPRIFEQCFVDEAGLPLLFIVKVVSVDQNGICTFNMKRCLREWAHDSISYGEKTVMKVKSLLGRSANGFSYEGLPLTAAIPEDFDSVVNTGDYLEVIFDTDDNMRHSNISVTAQRHTIARWDETVAFMNLINDYADSVLDDGDADEMEEVVQEGADLPDLYVRELILLFDRQAAVEPTIRSFNYLGAAHLLALIVDDKNLADYYSWRMKLLEMLQDFSINERIDEAQLEEMQKAAPDIFAPGSQLRLRFMQIVAVSCQGHPERNHELWRMVSEEKDENLKELASMILSWNFTADKEMNRTQEEINARIFSLLSLKPHRSTKKSFGKESRVVEFKTSLVYPPESHFRADIKTQTLTILKEVAAFLNTDGGTLYLGVNNHGVAEGLEADLAHRQFCYNPDKYDIYFHNKVKQMLGLEANSLVNCEWEEVDDKPIYVVKVKPCPHVVMLQDIVYERQDTSSEPLTGAYREEFIRKRPQLVMQMDAEQKKADQPKEVHENRDNGKPKQTTQLVTDHISTSVWRRNVLFDWEPDYVQPSAYLCFKPDDKFYLLSADQPPYTLEEYHLVLSIVDEDTSAHLILVFKNGRVGRVPMKEILEKRFFTNYKHVSEPILFACLAHESDYLLTAVRDDNNLIFYRTDKVESLPRIKITDSGELLNANLEYEILYADIVPSRLAQYCKEPPAKAIGHNAVVGAHGPHLRNDLQRELGIELPKP